MNQIEVLCREGWSSEEIRYFTGITHTQWNEYKRANLGFAKKLKYWRSQALKRVKKSLYQKAIGYRTIDEKQTILVDESGKHKITKVERYIRQHAPDSQAGIFILKNEEPLKYRDNVTLDVNNVSRLSNERIEQLFLKIKNKEREDEMEDTESSNE